jgi:hypothetical protein
MTFRRTFGNVSGGTVPFLIMLSGSVGDQVRSRTCLPSAWISVSGTEPETKVSCRHDSDTRNLRPANGLEPCVFHCCDCARRRPSDKHAESDAHLPAVHDVHSRSARDQYPHGSSAAGPCGCPGWSTAVEPTPGSSRPFWCATSNAPLSAARNMRAGRILYGIA